MPESRLEEAKRSAVITAARQWVIAQNTLESARPNFTHEQLEAVKYCHALTEAALSVLDRAWEDDEP